MDRHPPKSKSRVDDGEPTVDRAKRLIDLTAADLIEIVDARLAAFLSGAAPSANDDGLLDRAAAAKFLGISLSKLDLLCRDEEDPIPFVRVGDVRRFDRARLKAWALRGAE